MNQIGVNLLKYLNLIRSICIHDIVLSRGNASRINSKRFELKVTKSNQVSFSPHQISYHEERKNSPAFILVKRVLESSPRKPQLYIYSSDQVLSLSKEGLSLSPLSLSDPVSWSFVQEHLAFLIRRRTYDQLTGSERES